MLLEPLGNRFTWSVALVVYILVYPEDSQGRFLHRNDEKIKGWHDINRERVRKTEENGSININDIKDFELSGWLGSFSRMINSIQPADLVDRTALCTCCFMYSIVRHACMRGYGYLDASMSRMWAFLFHFGVSVLLVIVTYS